MTSGMTTSDRAAGCLVGLALGDAVGTTLEFRPRDTYRHVVDMTGGGPFHLPAGRWTDDTSMALALAESLLEHDRLDAHDLMNRFVDWWRRGRYSSTGACFDIGVATRNALARYERTGDPSAGDVDPMAAGNGSLMRLAPVAIWGATRDEATMRRAARDQSATTHASQECLDACEGYAIILRAALGGAAKRDAMMTASGVFDGRIGEILSGGWRGRSRSSIRSSGYVAHSLEAALWCVEETDDAWDAVLLAANLGDDADTTAAITGQLAGALYGMSGVPAATLAKLHRRDAIEALARDLASDADESRGERRRW